MKGKQCDKQCSWVGTIFITTTPSQETTTKVSCQGQVKKQAHSIPQIKVQLPINFEIWGPVSDDLGICVIYWCLFTVFWTPKLSQSARLFFLNLMFSSAEVYGDVDLIFQQELTPEHAVKSTNTCSIGLMLYSFFFFSNLNVLISNKP